MHGYTKKINYLENNIRTFTNITNGGSRFWTSLMSEIVIVYISMVL